MPIIINYINQLVAELVVWRLVAAVKNVDSFYKEMASKKL